VALKRRSFAKAAKRQVDVAPDFADRLEGLLRTRALALLGLAHRAGQVTFGFEKVAEALRRQDAAVLVQASDTAQGGRDKMRVALRAGECKARTVERFDREELSLALGRENVVHAALRRGGLATRFLTECDRLAGFCDLSEGTGDAGSRVVKGREPRAGVDLTGKTA
jgi:ribosomal protein L7Ae-like RNA K-turn-binding protein